VTDSSDGLTHRLRPAAGEPAGALVLLHGRGADENDLYPLLDVMDPRRRLVGATVRGPLSLPPGGAHWYAVRAIGYPDPGTFLPTYERLASWLDVLLGEQGIAHDRLVLGGFSQGSVMTYATALGKGRPAPAGIVAMSGFMPAVEGFELNLEGRKGLPAFISHGSSDPVIGVEWGRDASGRLQAAGADVTYHESPVAHGIDPRVMAELPDWVASAVPEQASSPLPQHGEEQRQPADGLG
jgi:phospholipase/carboxylesterase